MKPKRIFPYRAYEAVASLNGTSEEKKSKVIELYQQGFSQTDIEKSLKMTRKTIRTILKEKEINRSDSHQLRISRKATLNIDAFKTITPESAYWIGFLYADGHVGKAENGSGYNIEVGVHGQDKEHIQKFLDFLQCNNKVIKDSRGEYYRTRIGSQELHSSLKDYGFDNNKSFTATPPETLKGSRDFWRGVVDGDGCLHWIKKDNSPMLCLCGTENTIKGFIEFLVSKGVPTKTRGNRAKKGHALFQVNLTSKNARKATEILYKDSVVYMDRKYGLYQTYFLDTIAIAA